MVPVLFCFYIFDVFGDASDWLLSKPLSRAPKRKEKKRENDGVVGVGWQVQYKEKSEFHGSDNILLTLHQDGVKFYGCICSIDAVLHKASSIRLPYMYILCSHWYQLHSRAYSLGHVDA